MTLSTPPVLIPSGEAVPGREGVSAWAYKVRDSSLGRTEGWVMAHHGVGTPYGKGLVAGLASVLGKQTSCSLSDTPRQSSYDIYRVPSSQSMEDRGYVH